MGDELLEIDGTEIRTEGDFSDMLLETSERTSIRVLLQRGEEQLERSVRLVQGCPVKFLLSRSGDFQVITRQHSKLLVRVPEGVVSFVTDGDTLAVVLAHQFAHVLFDDETKPWPEQEARADRYGLLLAAAAGFDVSGAENYWQAVAMEYPWMIDEALNPDGLLRKQSGRNSHVGLANRMAAIRATVQEIRSRVASGTDGQPSP